jgi:hypothetical protein
LCRLQRYMCVLLWDGSTRKSIAQSTGLSSTGHYWRCPWPKSVFELKQRSKYSISSQGPAHLYELLVLFCTLLMHMNAYTRYIQRWKISAGRYACQEMCTLGLVPGKQGSSPEISIVCTAINHMLYLLSALAPAGRYDRFTKESRGMAS